MYVVPIRKVTFFFFGLMKPSEEPKKKKRRQKEKVKYEFDLKKKKKKKKTHKELQNFILPSKFVVVISSNKLL